MANTTPPLTMPQVLMQLATVGLTILGLSFTMTRPLFDKLNNVSDQLIELKANTHHSNSQVAALTERVRDLERTVYVERQSNRPTR